MKIHSHSDQFQANRSQTGQAPTIQSLAGQCFCGFVRYAIHGAHFNETNCHCSICRRTTGAPFVTWFTVRPTDFKLTAGEPAHFASSDHGVRTFCPRCGTQLTFRSSHTPDELDITMCSLNSPERLAPRDHTRTSSQLPWIKLADGIPAFKESRSQQ